MRIPEIKMKYSATTPPRKQEYSCPVCGRVIPLAPAYGSWALRAVMEYLFTRYEKHYNRYHSNEGEK